MDEYDEMTLHIEIDHEEYDFKIDTEEWNEMGFYERDEFLETCELEAREQYCAMRTSVKMFASDGSEVLI